ncbi:hypothetical protein AB0G60_21950 [Streptomyces angustmyceticus]|uniref:Uncharacterized protein n=1 Tax=Streptomyces angustmyceticus TaxID=285578 RepID=A0A5J4LG94_9ACTN|nr:hypothetical protein [Streptomyces angustmyceticus]UAL67054.1 hypothetical protein K7396_11320 [Streptomyces angustmyceticus]GES30669.1 hypothetical protein San01_31560 [Streptomyces angustmyceticus]
MPEFPTLSTIKRVWGRFLHLLAMIMLLALSVVFAWLGLTQAGVMGTHGTLTVAECYTVVHHHTSGKRGTGSTTDYTCTGEFRSDDGKTVAENAQISGLPAGHPKTSTIPGQRSGNEVVLPDDRGAAVKFAVAFGALLIDAFVFFWWSTRLDKNGLTLKETWRTTRGTPTRAIVVGVSAVAVVGVAAGALCAVALPG